MGPEFLAGVLKNMPTEDDARLLVGFNKADDAGVYKINDTQALVQTVDFFPPIVDDPYTFGQIAAANAISDIYAMGGQPLTALNIVAFPPKMESDILTQILRGGADKIHEAGATVVGGHSIKDNELKYGVAVTGIIELDNIITNDKAQVGDLLFLTKPLGTGIITTAIKNGKATDEDITSVSNLMTTLNKTASELMVKHGAHAATDVTGFGLTGHAFEMANGSNVTFELYFDKLPIIKNALEYAEQQILTGGAKSNESYLKDKIKFSGDFSRPQLDILYDPQTSGGLLIALPESRVTAFTATAKSKNLLVALIGKVTEKQSSALIIR